MRQTFYETTGERKVQLDEAHALGESMLHDDFVDTNGDPTDGRSGRLTFDVLAQSPSPVRDPRLVTLEGLLKNDTLDLSGMKELMRLERGMR